MEHFLENPAPRGVVEDELARQMARLAHDIRSPLLTLEKLIKSLHELSDERRHLFADSIQRIHSLAESACVSAASARLHKESSGRSEPFLQTLDRVMQKKWAELSTDRPGISLEIRLSRKLSQLQVAMDPVDVEQALTHLLTNAIQAIPVLGLICVSVSSTANEILVLVEDTGRGISAGVLAQLAKGERVSNRTSGSWGLGLKHTRREVQLAGGSLHIDSVLGRGTTIKMRLPIAHPLPS